jgi:hypothetical protein
MSGCTHCVTVRSAGRAGARRSWSDVWLLSLIVAVPAVLVVLAGYLSARGNHPTDEELIERFSSHESEFNALERGLPADCARLSPSATSCVLTDLARAGGAQDYPAVLRRIGATNLSYFPGSGTIIVPVSKPGESFSNTRKSYVYLSHDEPEPLVRRYGYAFRGPGIYFVTGDERIQGRWYIHHDGAVVIAFAPY